MSQPAQSASADAHPGGGAYRAAQTDDRGPCAVEAQGLTVIRGRSPILSDVHLAIATGESVAILGANGAGKTTLLACLAGALRPASGTIFWFGRTGACAPAVRRQIGYVGHECGLYAELTSLENLLFAARMHALDHVRDRAWALLGDVGLAAHAHQPAGHLSKGMRQRLAMARALVHAPPLLLLDEPFASLDVASRRWLEALLVELCDDGRTVCFASHNEAHSRSLADRLVWLDEGRIASLQATGDPADGRHIYRLRSA